MNIMKKIVNISLILSIGIVLGFALIVLTYLLPTNRIKENVKESINIFDKEKAYYQVVEGYLGTQLDNFTDSIMLLNAMYDGNESAINKSIQIYKYINNSIGNPTEQLVEFFENPNIEWGKSTYYRYWHGYLVFLKPALLVFNYLDIRMINQIIQTLLLVLIIFLLTKRNLKQYILPFIIAILSIAPNVIGLSLQFSTTLYISLISIIVILLFYEKIQSKEIYIFLIIGMITSFFDYLTCPILTLGMPLIILTILNKNNWKQDLKNIIVLSIMWGIGYAGMWIGKWIISCIILQKNLIADILAKVTERTSDWKADGGSITKLDVLKCNLKIIINIPNVLMYVSYFAYITYKAIKEKIWTRKNEYIKMLPFIIIALIPFLWYIFASNHSFEHCWFTYRSLAVTVFAGLAGIISVLFKNEKYSYLLKEADKN